VASCKLQLEGRCCNGASKQDHDLNS
jgi:hypothetical protein